MGTIYRRQLDIDIIKSNLDTIEKEINKENIEQFISSINNIDEHSDEDRH